jgi:hypothetical protein
MGWNPLPLLLNIKIMKNIDEYELISETFLSNVPIRIKELMKEGWQPYRDIKKVEDQYIQAMVKYKSETNKEQLND